MTFVRSLIALALLLASLASEAAAPTQPVFRYIPESPFAGANVTFDAMGTACSNCDFLNFNWSFGDGTANVSGRSLSKLKHTFFANGTYNVILTVGGSDGHWNSTQKTILVSPPRSQPPPWAPVAEFEYKPRWPFNTSVVEFDPGKSYDPDGEIVSYSWNFGDGKIGRSDYSKIEHQFNITGTLQVMLTVTDNSGRWNSTNKTIYLKQPTNTLPIAILDISPVNPYDDTEVILNASRSYDTDGNIVRYTWYIEKIESGSGTFIEQTEPLLKHTFYYNGTYLIILTVFDNKFNLSDPDYSTPAAGFNRTSKVITVLSRNNKPPVAFFTISSQNPAESEYVLFDTSGSYDPDGNITEYSLDVGDGTTVIESDENIITSHVYYSPGTYVAVLTVKDNRNQRSTFSRVITVQNEPLTASFSYSPFRPYSWQEVFFDASNSRGDISQYEWNFSDGTSEITFEPQAYHIFQSERTYVVRLTVRNGAGNSSSRSRNIRVTSSWPSVHVYFSISPRKALPGRQVTFDAGGSFSTKGRITRYEWDFGDGNIVSTSKPVATHQYNSIGDYAVTLTVFDSTGDQNSRAGTVRIVSKLNTNPVAKFNYYPARPKARENATFDASESYDPDGKIQIYYWRVNGSYHSVSWDSPITNIAFRRPNVYNVTLIVADNEYDYYNDGIAATSKLVTVDASSSLPAANSPPLPIFSIDPLGTKVNEDVTFDAWDSVDPDGDEIVYYEWEFGDGETEKTSWPRTYHTYRMVKSYDVVLKVTDEFGASARSSPKTVRVFDARCVDDDGGENFEIKGGVQGTGFKQSYEDFCVDKRYLNEYYCTPDSKNASEIFDCYRLKMICSNGECKKKGTVPVPIFTYFPGLPVADESTFLSADKSYSTDEFPITQFKWDFGDGSTGTGSAITHAYKYPGRYNVTLAVADMLESKNWTSATITVLPKVELNITNKTVTESKIDATFSIAFPKNIADFYISSLSIDFGDESGIVICDSAESCQKERINRSIQHIYNLTNKTKVFVAEAVVGISDLTVSTAKAIVAACADNDRDGYCDYEDCDDSDPRSRPFALEICDGRDNDCDGRIDEGFDVPGKILGNVCNDWKDSICKGVWSCSPDGSGVICRGNVSVGQKKEICANSLDDDCDGKTDETYEYDQADPQRPLIGCFGCNDGDEVLLSPAAGECGSRKKVCVGGEWVERTSYEKKPEVCNGKDDDCNGMVDDIGGARSREEARCQCFNGGLPASEVCDGIDNDCNGQIDEAGNCCKENDIMETGGKDVGICKPGRQVCQKGRWVEVSRAVGPQQETCENDVDDNCDGQINEGCPEKEACVNGIKDGSEEGVDCGGGCAPCTALKADSGVLLLAVAVLIIIVIGGALQFFGKI